MELVFMVFLWRICALFCDARDIDKSKLGTVSSNNEERAAKTYKMATNWARVSQKRQQRTEVKASQVLLWYLCLHLNVLTLWWISQAANSEKRYYAKQYQSMW